MRIHLRDNALFLFSLLAWVVIMVLATLVLDAQIYQSAKKTIIQEEYFERFPVFETAFIDSVREYLNAESEERRRAAEAVIRMDMRNILVGEHPILEFQVRRDRDVLIREIRRDNRSFSTWRNSLVLRNFRAVARTKIGDAGGGRRFAGELVLYYATPLDYMPILRLTFRYRVYLMQCLLIITLIYLLTLRLLVFPVRKVTLAIKAYERDAGSLLDHPRTQLERLFNAMARDAMITEMMSGARGRGPRALRSTLIDLFLAMQPLILSRFGFKGAWIATFRLNGSEPPRLVAQTPPVKSPVKIPSDAIPEEALEQRLLRELANGAAADGSRLVHAEARGLRLFAGALPDPRHRDHVRALVLLDDSRGGSRDRAWRESIASRIHRQLLDLSELRAVLTRELFEEKSEANINLSRSLGHDLTNIIATNKLELMTVKQLLNKDETDWLDSPDKRQIVRQTMERILNNTRGLQEIVNLYRAYEYLKHPRFERTDLGRLVAEIIDIFKLSMSSAAEIRFEPPDPAVALLVEPRLLKLALFNLFGNAQDAIRRLPSELQNAARIEVQILMGHDKKDVRIRVADSGPGIRTPDGRLANEEEIVRIFELGYTTKPGGQGEGLGLSWVRTILTEFHPGELTASNRTEGGAVFEWRIPSDWRPSSPGKRDHTE